jgi:gliding motility-associated-like protein
VSRVGNFGLVFWVSCTILIGRYSFAQSYPNLVPNPSFANIETCSPLDFSVSLSDWLPKGSYSNPWGTPDFFHNCNGYTNLYAGCNVTPLDSDGFIAEICSGVVGEEYIGGKEFTAALLVNPLQSHQNYCVSFYKNYCIDHSPGNVIFNNMCVGFFDQISTIDQPAPLSHFDIITHYVEDTIPYDTVSKGWQKVDYYYIADGTENWVLLGILGNNSQISHTFLSTDTLPGYAMGAYIFWDSIVVTRCHDEISMNIDNLFIPNVITPNGDNVNDYWILHHGDTLIPQVGIKIYNIWGELVYCNDNYHGEWHGQTHCGAQVSDGAYYYLVSLPPDQQKTGIVYVYN